MSDIHFSRWCCCCFAETKATPEEQEVQSGAGDHHRQRRTIQHILLTLNMTTPGTSSTKSAPGENTNVTMETFKPYRTCLKEWRGTYHRTSVCFFLKKTKFKHKTSQSEPKIFHVFFSSSISYHLLIQICFYVSDLQHIQEECASSAYKLTFEWINTRWRWMGAYRIKPAEVLIQSLVELLS